ncbi:MAG: efflux RND transporter permease subunit [Candidatus Cloacimonadales bacterium]
MKIAEFSVHRRITILMLTLLIIIVGALAFSNLGLEIFPDMNYPVISIITTYPGASSFDVEESVTKPIESAIAAVKGIKNITSESSENVSMISVEFDWDSNLDFAAQDLRDMIDQIASYLPEDVSRPLVMKFNLSQMPILMYGITGDYGSYELREILDEQITNKLKIMPGVASVMVMGGEELEKQIIIDKAKLEYFNLSIDEILQVVAMGNLNKAAGHITEGKDEYLLRTIAQYNSLQEIADLPIKLTASGQKIYLKDIATVKDGFRATRYRIRTNRQPTAMMMISKESGTNTLTVSAEVKAKISEIEADFGEKINFHEIMDMGLPISKVTEGAASNLLVGGLLAIAIMFLFLRNWRPTLAISLAIPISVIATFVPIYIADFTLNIMTIGGLALGVGMLVDNSIVVIENIYRHVELGKSRRQAAIDGTSQVAMAITASTLTTIAVFFPMLFAEGITGILVRGLTLTVSFSLFASLFVSLTIVPALASILFRKNNQSAQPRVNKFRNFQQRYKKILVIALHNRGKTLALVVILFLASFALIPIIGTEFMPAQDIPFLTLNVKMPVGTTLDETDQIVSQLEKYFLELDAVMNVMALVGPMDDAQAQADPTNPQGVNEAQIFGRLKQIKDRDLDYEEIQDYIRARIPEIAGAELSFLTREEMMGGGSSKPLEINIFGDDLEQLRIYANQIERELQKVENVSDVVNSLKVGKPETHIIIDKDRAFDYGLTSAQIANAISTSTIGSLAGIFRSSGKEIDIRVILDEESRNSFDDIMQLPISSPLGFTVPLNQIAHLEKSIGPRSISHEHQTRKVFITANISGTQDLGGVVGEVKAATSAIIKQMPADYFVEFSGSYKDMQEGFQTLTLALLLAIFLVYIVMASQFESLRQPFIVMFTIPLGFIGVLVILGITGTTLSIASFVGAIVLSGIVVNNGIVLVDHMNQLRIDGMAKFEAIVQAAQDRLRPVLITTSTTVLGMLPMALSSQEGSELKSPMALTVIGGLLSATFFTLFVVPVIYSLVAKKVYMKEESEE